LVEEEACGLEFGPEDDIIVMMFVVVFLVVIITPALVDASWRGAI